MARVVKESAAPKPPIISVMAGREFASRLKVVAARRGLTMAEALDQFAGPAIMREYRRCVDEMNRELGESGA